MWFRKWFACQPLPRIQRTILNLETLEERNCPAAIHVTTLIDVPLGVAHTGVTLRDAVSASITRASVNGSVAGTGTDQISFDITGTIVLAFNDSDVAFGPTALVIKDHSPGNPTNITIENNDTAGYGSIQAAVILDGDNPTVVHRIFGIKAGNSLTLNQVTLQNGEAHGFLGGFSVFDGGVGGGGAAGLGGAIFNFQGNLTISNSTLTGNVGLGGGPGFGAGFLGIDAAGGECR